MSNLLIPEPPLQVLPSLAKLIGLNEAIILQQIHYWLQNKNNNNIYEGKKWVYNSYPEWQKQFPFWSITTIKRAIRNLERQAILVSKNFNKMKIDRTKWYTINYEQLAKINTPSGQNDPITGADCTHQEGNLTPPIPETSPETSPENTTSKSGDSLSNESDSPYKPSLNIQEEENTFKEENTEKKKKQEKRKYGEFQNVLLTDTEYQKLKDRFNSQTDDLIENLSVYLESKGKKYKSHYATILSWERKNSSKGNKPQVINI